jgi:hypothetical protein
MLKPPITNADLDGPKLTEECHSVGLAARLQIPSVAKSTKPVRGLSVLELLDLCFKNTAMLDHQWIILIPFLSPKMTSLKSP